MVPRSFSVWNRDREESGGEFLLSSGRKRTPPAVVGRRASQDPILGEERVDDHPEDERHDHGDEEDSLEDVPGAFQPRLPVTGPVLAAAVPAGDAARLDLRRDAARRHRRFHLAQLCLLTVRRLRLRQLEPRRALHLKTKRAMKLTDRHAQTLEIPTQKR